MFASGQPGFLVRAIRCVYPPAFAQVCRPQALRTVCPASVYAPEIEEGRDFYLSGAAVCIQEPAIRHVVVGETGIHMEPGRVMFEPLVEPVIMYTRLVAPGSPEERP